MSGGDSTKRYFLDPGSMWVKRVSLLAARRGPSVLNVPATKNFTAQDSVQGATDVCGVVHLHRVPRGVGTTSHGSKSGSKPGPQIGTQEGAPAAAAGRRTGGAQPRTGGSNLSARSSAGASALYSHSSAPTAVRSRSGGASPAPHAGSIASAGAAVAAAGRGAAASSGLDSPLVDDGFGSGSDDGREVVTRADLDRERIRRILYGGAEDGTDGAACGGLLAQAPTEQDASCEVAAAGIILACQAGGVCDASMRGITRLPPAVIKFFRAEGALVSELQLQGNRLGAVPPLELLPSLTRLDLSTNLLTEVPASVGKLRRLRDLDLSRNQQLTALPEALCDLTSLTRLDLSHNSLEFLPLRMGQLVRLVEMRLDSNQLSYLPSSCAGLPSLTALHASRNRLTGLPSELGGAFSLTGIFLAHNRMTALPATIGQLRQRLAELQLHNNELTVLPREVGRLAALTHITTSGNPLVHPPLAVARRGVAAVREYLLGGWHGDEGQEQEEEGVDGDALTYSGCGGADGGGGGGEREQGAEPAGGSGAQQGQGQGGGQGGGQGQGQSGRRRGGRRLVIGAACKACVDKDDRIEELGQLLNEARERLERSERQLEHSREQLNRQAKDLAQQAIRAVEADAEISRLSRQLAAASLLPGYRGPPPPPPQAAAAARPAAAATAPAAGPSAPSGGDVEEHLRCEVRQARGAAEVAQAAAEAAEREVKRLRREAEEWRLQFLAERERAEELTEAVRKERERCNAAVAAATEATHKFEELRPVMAERDELLKKLQAAQGANKQAWQAADVAREGYLVSEAAADVIQGRMTAIEAANRRLTGQIQGERRASAAAAAAAESRERQLQMEITRLQGGLTALMSEREVLRSVTPTRGMGDAAVAAHRAPTPPTGPASLAQTSARSSWAAPQVI